MDARRTFAPLVLLGLASSAATAVAGSRRLMVVANDALVSAGVEPSTLDRIQGDTDAEVITGSASVAGDLPLVGALALVLLALWGVLLVTRGRVRVVTAWAGVLAAAGTLAALVAGFVTGTDGYAEALWAATGHPGGQRPEMDVEATTWFWVGCVAAVLALVVTLLATRMVAHWPAMGSRYDAPGSQSSPAAPDPATASSTDLWKSLDEGHDPTA
ncbi:Trp biosynthesis-associated membrane protein [Nocardioides sp. AE5]|uniref:Trp biosynthesis-associated membrane protein n=1 Tax=Nocardioides sp. AE5 TaxID=2962573 RepID=UPI0028817EC3|nr:Trp biosynthesis-associated membrane protein [Nocardioides sp. AE5]MDT0201286.1 Trp biosynthesis-associated membrane protein [Nocardioides sp. AE5]